MSQPIQNLKASADRKVAISVLRNFMADAAEIARLTAQIRRAHYEASLKEGFSKEEALQLCMKTTL